MEISKHFIPLYDFYWKELVLQSGENLADQVTFYLEDFPDIEKIEVVIFGVPEYRTQPLEELPEVTKFNDWRRFLYSLSKTSRALKIADLGDLRLGDTLEDTVIILESVLNFFLEKQILPIFVGGGKGLALTQFKAYESFEKLISFLTVDTKFSMKDKSRWLGQGFHHKILTHYPNYLLEFIQLGYQRFDCDKRVLDGFEGLGYDIHSVGALRQNWSAVEPLVRRAQAVHIDLEAVTGWPVKDVMPHTAPFGFSGEEMSQICWYAGLNARLSSIGFSNWNPSLLDEHKGMVKLFAVALWYLFEGVSFRQPLYNFDTNYYMKYTVDLMFQGHHLVFYKSTLSDKWWMELYSQKIAKSWLRKHCVIPCSYKDYLQAREGQLPDQWRKGVDRLEGLV